MVAFPLPPSLAEVLRLAGFQGSIVVERIGGDPLSKEETLLAQGILEFHEKPVSNPDIQRVVAAHLAGVTKP